MKHFFSQRQRFSLRKYSFGLASVLLGTAIFSNAQSAQANEVETTSSSSIATTASGTEALVEETVVAANPTVNPTTVEATAPAAEVSSTSTINLATSDLASAAPSSQAASQTASTVDQTSTAASQVASASEAAEVSSVTVSTAPEFAPQAVPAKPVAAASQAAVINPVASSEVAASETAASSESNQVNAQGQVTTIPLAALEQMLPSRSFARLMNSINAAAAERNRGQRGQEGTNAFRVAFADSGETLVHKLEALLTNPVQTGRFMDSKYFDQLKLEEDNDHFYWIYDFKIYDPNYIDAITGKNIDVEYVGGESIQMGHVDFVDANGNAISGVTARTDFAHPTISLTIDGNNFENIFDVALAKLPAIPAGYRLKTVNGDPTKVEAYVDILEQRASYEYKDLTYDRLTQLKPSSKSGQTLKSPEVWKNKQKQTITLIKNADGSFSLDPSVDAVGSTLAPAYKYHLVLEADETDTTKSTSQTITYTGTDKNPASHVDNSFTFTGKKNAVTGDETWDSSSHTYGSVTTPIVSGYYADKATAGGQTVTPDNPDVTDTVTYKPLGQIIFVDEAGNQIPGTTAVTFNNNSSDPTRASETAVPGLPTGYEIKDGQTLPIVTKRDGSIVATPTDPSTDIRIVLRNGQDLITKPTSQTVHFTGAGSATPADKVQDDFTFSGTRDKVTGNETWNQANHTYGSENVPVLSGYFADKATAGHQTVTPAAPNATDTVTYVALGKIIPVDEDGNPIAGVAQPQYENDASDPTKAGQTSTPVIPGYVADTSNVTPTNPGADTTVTYRKADQKAVVVYLDQTTGATLENEQLTGKSGEAIAYTTASKIQSYLDRGYELVSDDFPVGARFDTDASVDQTWTVTLKHGTAPVGPSNPQTPGTPINPNDPNGPKWPAQDQYLKDVTARVKYVSTDGSSVPSDHVETAQWSRTLTIDKVTGTEVSATAWTADKSDYAAVTTPVQSGYYADKASVASKAVVQTDLEETVTYAPLGHVVLVDENGRIIAGPSQYSNDANDPTKAGATTLPSVPAGYDIKAGQTIAGYNPSAATVTPANPGTDTQIILVAQIGTISQAAKQTVSYTGAGSETPADKVQNFTFTGSENAVTGDKDWDQNSHDFGTETVPVISGYFADKATAGGKTVTPDAPEATDTVTYTKLGKIVPVDEAGNPIPGADTPVYANDPSDPTKGGVTAVPSIPGYTPQVVSVTPGNPGSDTTVVYVPNIDDVTKATKQTVTYTGAGSDTPTADVQDDYSFQGKYNQVDQTTTWTDNTHTYGTVKVPVVTGYYADKATAGGQTVTPDAPEATDTVTYASLGKIILVDESGQQLAGTAAVVYSNDATDATKVVATALPSLPNGYQIKVGQTLSGFNATDNTVTASNLGQDTLIVLVAKVGAISQAAKQTVSYTGAGSETPADKVQNFTFTGSENAVTGDKDWDQNSHDFGTETVPVISGYFADKATAGGQTVTPDAPEATDTVTYTKLGKIIPVDASGNPIPGADTPVYANDPSDPTKGGETAVPSIPGYTPNVLTVTPGQPGSDTTVIYIKDTQKALILYVNEKGNLELAKAEVTGKSGEAINYSTEDQIAALKRQGYELVSDGFASAGDKTFDLDQTVDQSFTVILRERVMTVDPKGPNPKVSDPVDPSDPDTPHWPTSVFALDNHDDVTRTVAYVYENGRQAANDVVETLHFQRVAHVNLVTGEISYDAWTTSKDSFEAVTTPTIPGYTADQAQLPAETGVLAGTADSRVVVTFAKDVQKVTVSYVDQTSGQTLAEDQLTGKSGELISYSTADKIKDYQDKGYVLVSVDFPSQANFDLDQTVDQHFTVIFKHDTVATTETKETTATVRYVSTDAKASVPADKVQTAQWTRTVTHDKVTGEVLATTPWTADKETYDAVTTPVVTGYFADQAQVAAQAVTESNIETVVTYTPFGKIIPVDANGHLIPGAETPLYINDPSDPTKALVTTVPTVPGYKTDTRQVTPSDPGQDTKVVYIRDVPTTPVTPQPDEDSYIVIEYRDEAGNKIRPDRIISSRYGANYDVSDGDPYIYRNGVRYEKIRQENTTGKAGKGRTTVTYIYRRVDDPAPAGVGTNTTTRSQESTVRPNKAQETQVVNQTAEELPVTGETSSAMTGLGAFLLGLLAFLGFRPKKKQEDK